MKLVMLQTHIIIMSLCHGKKKPKKTKHKHVLEGQGAVTAAKSVWLSN